MPSGWTGLLPGSLRRVPVAEIKMLVRKKKDYIRKEKIFFTLFIDRLRDMTLLTLVQIENFLSSAACGLLIGPKKRSHQIF